jgi:hypothetical protein
MTLHKALIRSVITYACPAWEFAADTRLHKLKRLQNEVLRTIGNFSRRTSVREMHMAFHLTYVYSYMTKLCRQQAEVILNHDNQMFAILVKAKPDIENIRGLNLAAVRHTTVQVTRLQFNSDRINRRHKKDSRVNVSLINLYFSTTCFGLTRTIIR